MNEQDKINIVNSGASLFFMSYTFTKVDNTAWGFGRCWVTLKHNPPSFEDIMIAEEDVRVKGSYATVLALSFLALRLP